MAISTLSKITVPLASDASASTQGLLMPKLQYRFRVTLENFGVSTPTTELTKPVIDAIIDQIAKNQKNPDPENPVFDAQKR